MPKLSRLSPKARKVSLMGGAGRVRAMVELSGGHAPETMGEGLAAVGAELQGWSAQSRVLTLTLPADRLTDLAGLSGVAYVETGSVMRGE